MLTAYFDTKGEHLGPRFLSMKEFYKQYDYDFYWLDDEEKEIK